MIGEAISHYKITGKLGEGGMGVVFKAEDTKLERTVALKFLAAHLVLDDSVRKRFEREAKAAAALNHPNICTVYEIDTVEGRTFIAMAFIEGQGIDERIAAAPLKLDEALDIAQQIAQGLQAAHGKGIVHRDIKPANVMVTGAGSQRLVTIMDFGLAQLAEHSKLTRMDETMGTVAYMSPEQTMGVDVDHRSDIWAFGVVLYEMITGQRPFKGHYDRAVMYSITSEEPEPVTALRTGVPMELEWIIGKCLAKDTDSRYQTAGELAVDLKNLQEKLKSGRSAILRATNLTAGVPAAVTPGRAVNSVETLPPGAVIVQQSRQRALQALAAAFAIAFLVTGVGWYSSTTPPAPSRPLIRLNAEIAPDAPLARVNVIAGFGGNMLALSPDGSRLAITLRGADGQVRLHTRLLHQSQITPLAGTENAYSPFFSPAGDWIGFFAEGKLKKVAVEGGAALTLCDAPLGYGGSWGDDGNIIAALNNTGVLWRVPSSGGTPVPVTTLNSGEATHRWPHVLPGSQAILFTAAAQTGTGYDDANIEVISLKTGERKTIERGGFSPHYLAETTGSNGTGHLIYLNETTLFAVPFDSGHLASMGSAAPILEDVSSTLVAGGDFAFGQNGTFVYLSGEGGQSASSISWIDSSGKTQPLHAPPGLYRSPRFSPDGKRLAFSMGNGQGADIWVKDLDRDTPSRLTFLPGLNGWPVWTPDGHNIVFRSTNPAAPGLYGVRSDGSGEAKRLTVSQPLEFPYSFSPDGKRLAVYQAGNGGSMDIFTMAVEADPGQGAVEVRLGKAELFLGTPFIEVEPEFSPDGRWLAYTSSESGTYDVYIRPFPGPGGRWQVSAGGGRFPRWSRDGRALLFETLDQHVMAVSYTAKGDSFAAAKPRVWTETRLLNTAYFPNYDLAPDGKRLAAFVADDAKGEKPLTHLTFLLNFFDELRRKVPTGQ